MFPLVCLMPIVKKDLQNVYSKKGYCFCSFISYLLLSSKVTLNCSNLFWNPGTASQGGSGSVFCEDAAKQLAGTAVMSRPNWGQWVYFQACSHGCWWASVHGILLSPIEWMRDAQKEVSLHYLISEVTSYYIISAIFNFSASPTLEQCESELFPCVKEDQETESLRGPLGDWPR